MKRIVFVDGVRTPFGKLGGSFRKMTSTDIASLAVRELVRRTGILERGKIDFLYAGSALGDAVAGGPARYTLLEAGLPVEIPATYIEMQCGSAITAINLAACRMIAGLGDVAVVGGMESYSTYPAKFSMSVEPYKLIPPTAIKTRLSPDPAEDIDMITVSDNMAEIWEISRKECDEYALRSQKRLEAAYQNGISGSEIVPVVIPATRKTPEIIVDKDEFPRPESTMEGLSKLRSVREGGVTTAGNSSGRNDGAAFVLMMTEEKALEYGYEPRAAWVTGAEVGVRPGLMGIGPAYSGLKALKQAGIRISDLDVMECNEAFAAQNLAVVREMEKQSGETVDMEKWNPNGGAIAVGHPNGASGGRIAMFAMKHLEKTGGRYGMFSSCCGGGHGTTAVIENLLR